MAETEELRLTANLVDASPGSKLRDAEPIETDRDRRYRSGRAKV
jgi:hypothetical protein